MFQLHKAGLEFWRKERRVFLNKANQFYKGRMYLFHKEESVGSIVLKEGLVNVLCSDAEGSLISLQLHQPICLKTTDYVTKTTQNWFFLVKD